MSSIAILHPKFVTIGGAENLVASAVEVLAQQKWSIDIYTTEYKSGVWPNLDRLPVHTVANRWRRIFKSKFIDAMVIRRRLGAEIKDVDCIMAVNFPAPTWATSALRKHPRAKGVWYCNEPKRNLYPEVTEAHIVDLDKYVPQNKRKANAHFYKLREHLLSQRDTLHNRRDRAWEKRVVRDFDYILSCSEYGAQVAHKIYGLPSACCYPAVLPEVPPNSNNRTGAWTVGTVATFAERKNLLNVSRAFEHILVSRSDIRIRVGTGQPQKLHDFWRANGLEHLLNRIEIVNTATNADLYKFYSSLDLNLYLTIDEPLGLIPVEAAFCGTPSLLSDHAGPAELSGLGFGATVSPFDDDAIAEKIAARCGHRPSQDEKALLQNLARRYFGPEVFMNRFARQLEGIKT